MVGFKRFFALVVLIFFFFFHGVFSSMTFFILNAVISGAESAPNRTDMVPLLEEKQVPPIYDI